MVFLVKTNGSVRAFYSDAEMIAAGYNSADKTVTDEEFNSNGCYSRIINGEIIVGKTEEEKQAEELTEQINAIDAQLSALDGEYLTPRILGGIALKSDYALEQILIHEREAVPLREEREILKNRLDVCIST